MSRYDFLTTPVIGGENVDITSGNHTFTKTARAIWVGNAGAGEGDVSVVTTDGSTVVFKGIPFGTMIPVMAKQVNQTGTTATEIVGLW